MRTAQFFSHLGEIEHPQCDTCGAHMWLARIEPDEPDFDKRTFECPVCEAVTIQVVKYR